LAQELHQSSVFIRLRTSGRFFVISVRQLLHLVLFLADGHANVAHLAEGLEEREVVKILFNVLLISQLFRDEATARRTFTTTHLRHHLLEHIELEAAVVQLPDCLLYIISISEKFSALLLVSSGRRTNKNLGHRVKDE
jgi:hypothetical protein